MKGDEYTKKFDNLFRPKKHLGSGTFGVVQKSLSKLDGKTYAVKILQKVSVLYLDSIRQEAEAMKRAKSDYTVQLVDHFFDQDIPAYIFVMPYYRKGNLTRYLMEDWSRLDILCFLFQICQAFLSFNKQGACWHLDLKPDNILVKAAGQYLICDFGCAKLVDNINNSKLLTISEGRGGGTAQYAAPQLILNFSGGRFSDIWSLGVMLYMILYRKHPLKSRFPENTDISQMMNKFVSGQVEIEYPYIQGKEQIILICKQMLQPHKRLQWQELKRVIYQCIGLPSRAEIVSNIEKFILYAQNVSKIALGLVYYLQKNEKSILKFNMEAYSQKVMASAKAYVSHLYRQVQSTIESSYQDKISDKNTEISFYIFPQVKNNYTHPEKKRLGHLRSVAQGFCWKEYNDNMNINLSVIKNNFEKDVEEFLTVFKQKGMDKITLSPLSEWEKIEKICSFIAKTNQLKYPGLEYADREILQKFAHEIVYQ